MLKYRNQIRTNNFVSRAGLALLGFWLAAGSMAGEECLYTTANIDKTKYFDNREFKAVKWDDKTHTAHVITRSGEPLIIKNWACEHLSMEGQLTLQILGKQSPPTYILEKTIWLSNQLLEPEDSILISTALEGKEYQKQLSEGQLSLILDGKYFSWLSLDIKVKETTAIITLFGSLN